MKIGIAQIQSEKGQIQKNIEAHKKMIDLAIANGTDMIIFPELSITNYEPELAKELATDENDNRLQEFQQISDTHKIAIGVGMPLKAEAGIHIGMIIFQPHQPIQTYSKQYLHEDELPYFVSGNKQVFLTVQNNTIAPAICYELSVPAHAEYAHQHGANIYLTSVAKSASGVEKATRTLADTARKYNMIVLMANNIGPADNFIGAGNSAIWNTSGEMIAQLNDTDEGLLIVDTDTQEVLYLHMQK